DEWQLSLELLAGPLHDRERVHRAATAAVDPLELGRVAVRTERARVEDRPAAATAALDPQPALARGLPEGRRLPVGDGKRSLSHRPALPSRSCSGLRRCRSPAPGALQPPAPRRAPRGAGAPPRSAERCRTSPGDS